VRAAAIHRPAPRSPTPRPRHRCARRLVGSDCQVVAALRTRHRAHRASFSAASDSTCAPGHGCRARWQGASHAASPPAPSAAAHPTRRTPAGAAAPTRPLLQQRTRWAREHSLTASADAAAMTSSAACIAPSARAVSAFRAPTAERAGCTAPNMTAKWRAKHPMPLPSAPRQAPLVQRAGSTAESCCYSFP